MRVSITSIPHAAQRYDTVGDYFVSEAEHRIFVSEMENERHEYAVGLHELIESTLCKFRGIFEAEITRFDVEYEASRKSEKAPCGCKHHVEPGDDPHAPYYREHQFATIIERQFIHEMGINWQTYNNDLPEENE